MHRTAWAYASAFILLLGLTSSSLAVKAKPAKPIDKSAIKFRDKFVANLPNVSAKTIKELTALVGKIEDPDQRDEANRLLSTVQSDQIFNDYQVAPAKLPLGKLYGTSRNRLPEEVLDALGKAVPSANVTIRHCEFMLDASDRIWQRAWFPVKAKLTLDRRVKGADGILEVEESKMTDWSVTVDGKPVPFYIENNRLHFEAPGAKEVTVGYRIKVQNIKAWPDHDIYGLFRNQKDKRLFSFIWPTTGALFPSNSQPRDGVKTTFAIHLKAPAREQVVAADTHSHSYPAYASAINVGRDYKIVEGGTSRSGVKVTLYGTDNMVSTKQRKAHAERMVTLLDFAERKLGPYEFGKTFSLVEERAFHGSMEHAGKPLIGGDDKDGAYHEFWHMYFGNNRRIRTWGEIFMSESLTEYWNWRGQEHAAGKAVLRKLLESKTADIDKDLRSPTPPPRTLFGTGAQDALEVWNDLHYNLGPWMMRMLEKQLGRDRFDALFKRFYEANRSTLSIRTFVDFLRDETGTDFTRFFEDWSSIREIPRFEARVESNGQGVRIGLRARSYAPEGLEIPVRVYGAGEFETVMVKAGAKNSFKLPFAVERVAFDPEKTVLARVERIPGPLRAAQGGPQ